MTKTVSKNSIYGKLLCIILALVLTALCAVVPSARAASFATSIGLAEHGIKAYNEGWKYQYGGKGQSVGGTRVSDCAGLIYAYFSDMGMNDPAGNCSGHVNLSKFHGTISECLPNIHGLLLTMPEYYAPETGIYSHIGIYVGAGMVTDNSDYNTNMRYLPVNTVGRDWNAWHLLDNGLLYPSSGWYKMDGKMTHYTNYEYDTDTIIDGLTINSEGYAVDEAGEYLPVDESMLSSDFVSASTVAAYLATRYSGVDNTSDLVYGTAPDPEDPSYNGTITGAGVNLRAEPNTNSKVVAVLHRGDLIKITGTEEGMKITSDGETTTRWYAVTTSSGKTGYVCSLFASRRSVPGGLEAPVITSDGFSVTITSNDPDAYIYYTTDGSEPTEESTPYVSPVYMTGYTYKAVAVKDGGISPVATATVTSNGTIFTDFTYSNWFANSVDKAVGYGLFKGVGDNRFDPSSNVKRGQLVLVLANLAGVDLSSYNGVTDFTDVAPGAYYAKAIQWASQQGFVSGKGGGVFNPESEITRQEMCVMLSRYMGLQPVSGYIGFDDDGQIASWAKGAVYACRDAGIISGVGGNRFDPYGTATRAQACVVAVNCYNA